LMPSDLRERHSDVTACRQRAPTLGLMVERLFRFRLNAGRQLIIRDLFCIFQFDKDFL